MQRSGMARWRARVSAGAVLCAAALAVSACKKTPTAPIKVAATNTVAPVTKAVVAAIEATPFTFPNGGGALAPALTGQTITLTVTNTAAATPTTTIAVPGVTGTNGQPGRVVASTTFGSCIFLVTSSNIASIPVGSTITVPNCTLNVGTAGAPATGATVSVPSTMTLGTSTSSPVNLPVTVSPTGTVTVGTTTVGTTTTVTGTGAG